MRSDAHSDAREPVAPKTGSAVKLYVLRAKDMQAPPFHFTAFPASVLVAAAAEDDARRMASNNAGQPGGVWTDAEMTTCEVFEIDKPGVIAIDLRA